MCRGPQDPAAHVSRVRLPTRSAPILGRHSRRKRIIRHLYVRAGPDDAQCSGTRFSLDFRSRKGMHRRSHTHATRHAPIVDAGKTATVQHRTRGTNFIRPIAAQLHSSFLFQTIFAARLPCYEHFRDRLYSSAFPETEQLSLHVSKRPMKTRK